MPDDCSALAQLVSTFRFDEQAAQPAGRAVQTTQLRLAA
jgi:hypothetical protein